jgi:hypothetical protein
MHMAQIHMLRPCTMLYALQAPQRERVTLASRPPVRASSPLRPASPADAAASSAGGSAAAGSGRTTASSIAGGASHSSGSQAVCPGSNGGGFSGIQVHGSASALTRRPGSRFKKKRRWQDLISPDLNFGVPQLMMILEPNVVWDHNLSLVGRVKIAATHTKLQQTSKHIGALGPRCCSTSSMTQMQRSLHPAL